MIDRNLTGAELAAFLKAEAQRRGIPLRQLIAPLTRDTGHWLAQLRLAQRPKSTTFDRVDALLAGEDVPPAPLNNFQSRSPRHRPPLALPRDALLDRPRGPDRTPCPRCGVRADIGCRHSRAPAAQGAFA